MRKYIFLTLLFILISGGFQLTEAMGRPQYGNVLFKSIGKSEISAWESNENLIIKNHSTLAEVWAKTHSSQNPTPQVPEVDFRNNMVIAVFAGEKKSERFSIEIKRIMYTKSETRVFIEENSPYKNCKIAEAVTSPYQLVSLPKIPGKISFFEKINKIPCTDD